MYIWIDFYFKNNFGRYVAERLSYQKVFIFAPQTIPLHPFNSLVSMTTWVSRHQKAKTSLDLNEARGDGVLRWQWHQLDHTKTIFTSLQTDNHNNTSSHNFYRPDALPDAQPTVSKHRRQFLHLKAEVKTAKKVIARQVSVISGDTLTQYTTGFTFSINNKTGPKTKTKVLLPETKITQSSDKFSTKNEHKRNYCE